MGGLFSLTRHAGMHIALDDAPRPKLSLPESKSYFMGSLPGMILAVGTGLVMLMANPSIYLKADLGWGPTFHVKLLLVVILIVIDQVFLFKLRTFHKNGLGTRKLFMALHGSIGLCFIIIVLLMMTRIMA